MGEIVGIDMTELPDRKVSESVKKALIGEEGFYEGHYKSVTSGKITPVKVMFAPIQTDNGNVSGGVGLVEDISERIDLNRTLTKFRLGIDRSSNPIYITDQDGYIQYANPAFEVQYGFIAIQDNITDRVVMEEKIRQSLNEKDVMLAEIHHRVKYNLAIISGLLELETFDTDNKQTADFIRKSQTRIKSMAIVHEKLYQSNNLSNVNLREYVKELTETIRTNWTDKKSSLNFDLKVDEVNININQAIPLSLLFMNL